MQAPRRSRHYLRNAAKESDSGPMFWDSSALVTALLTNAHSDQLIEAFDRDPTPAIWWTTPVECRSAVVRAAVCHNGLSGDLLPDFFYVPIVQRPRTRPFQG